MANHALTYWDCVYIITTHTKTIIIIRLLSNNAKIKNKKNEKKKDDFSAYIYHQAEITPSRNLSLKNLLEVRTNLEPKWDKQEKKAILLYLLHTYFKEGLESR